MGGIEKTLSRDSRNCMKLRQDAYDSIWTLNTAQKSAYVTSHDDLSNNLVEQNSVDCCQLERLPALVHGVFPGIVHCLEN
jgi:hypothetical protein